jgi:hypothetical protein
MSPLFERVYLSIFWTAVLAIIVLLILSMTGVVSRDFAVIFATLLAGMAAVGVIFWQGSLLKQQIQFQSYMDLDQPGCTVLSWADSLQLMIRAGTKIRNRSD